MDKRAAKEKGIKPGMKFGRLTVIRWQDRVKSHDRFRCKCECGNEITVIGSNLKSGHTKSCGCVRSPDRSGERFGMLTVIGRTDMYSNRGDRKARLWKCRCDCGEIVYRAMDTLTTGRNCSCMDCAQKISILHTRSLNGYVDGTTLSKLRSKVPFEGNKSGRRGVCVDPRNGHWKAYIKFKGITYHLGVYEELEDAIRAREAAEEVLYVPMLKKYKYK